MAFSFLVVIVQVLVVQCLLQEAATHSDHSLHPSNHSISLYISSKKSEEGEWVTMFHASKSDSMTTNITMDLKQSVYYMDQNEAVHIKGLIRANGGNSTSDRLMFHPNCGKNAAISNDGRTVEKIKLEESLNGVVLTQRPLRRNELFQVRMDKKINKFNRCLGIGVTIYAPDSLTIPDHMYHLKSGNWMMYHRHVYIHGVQNITNYGKSFDELQVGDRIGVMVNNFGTLYFFINGVNQGPAASSLPSTLYGVFQFFGDAAKGTIVG